MKEYNKANIPLAKTLRKNMTPWERKLWYEFLRYYPIRFQRQKAIGNYIADFYCANCCETQGTVLCVAWSYLNNCSSFATRVWNEVSSISLSAGTPDTPTSLMSSIKSKNGYEMLRAIQYNTNIGYISGGVFVPVTISTNARNSNMDMLNIQNDSIEFIVPINFNPNSSNMEVWYANEKKTHYVN